MNTVDFSVASDWGSGFSANLSIANSSTSSLNGWTLEFDAPFTITEIWNAEIVSRQGSRYVIRNASWNRTIVPTSTASFGFNGSKASGAVAQPTNFILNGSPLNSGGAVALPTLSIADRTIAEGNTGTAPATFDVQLSQASQQTVTVQYATANGTATAGSDYTASTNTLRFAPGETKKTITVGVLGDTIAESNETFSVRLSGATNATIADGEGVGTITNDDVAPVPIPTPAPTPAPTPIPTPNLSIGDVTVTEGNTGAATATFSVNLSASSTRTIDVNFATANRTAIANSDYTSKTGTLRFAPGETRKTIEVSVLGDTIAESGETFAVNLSSAANATIADGEGVATIIDNDAPPASSRFNYGEALEKSFLFYEAQRSGRLPSTNRIAWRGDSALRDGADVGVDLTGGYYDAGDHVKFGFPMAASMTMLGWGVVQYRSAYQQSGQLDEALDAIKWGTDYILKAHTAPNEFWGQVGLGGPDHAYWGPPETMTMARPAFKIDAQRPGSDLAGEAAAALAAASIAFRPTDAAYADRLLTHATQLFSFADTYRGKYSDSIPDAANFYPSYSYTDELVWSATWLHKAIEAKGGTDTFYLNKAQSYYQGVYQGWTQSWDEKSHGAAVLLAQETGNSRYRTDVENWLNHWSDKSGAGIRYTPGGFAWLDQWGSARYSANTAFVAGVYSDTVNDPGGGSASSGRYSNFAADQIDYLLGDNPNNRSYVVGFGNNAPRNPHHRAAHGSTTNNINDPLTNRNVLTGALVGGLSAPNDNAYVDDRTNFITNEVALDYNAAFTGALARMYQEANQPFTRTQALAANSVFSGSTLSGLG
ncbi:glycoside hydrolase family 9 protein [Microcoleus sp. FACHB-1515]|uniref:glycoside hydrolase family 9 protein n=1 Tax=Cyanophyceae TaxID=3028117 RepID=UPI001682F640|nr:glycoside hydrolase family 9 protein [Microcoleus sp. FACHB-1515]MBD2091798.1 glycoside hydrolase family 9 protein [Microcoleus sp. FACHB-1515]